MFVSVQFKLEFENKHLPARQACQRGRQAGSAWRVLKVTLVLPLLREFFVRNFSLLKSALIQGKWQRQASRLVPFGFGGTMPRENTG